MLIGNPGVQDAERGAVVRVRAASPDTGVDFRIRQCPLLVGPGGRSAQVTASGRSRASAAGPSTTPIGGSRASPRRAACRYLEGAGSAAEVCGRRGLENHAVRVPGIRPAARQHTGVAESIDTVSAPPVQRGAPRDAKAAAALARYDRIARLPLVLSALLPLVIAPEPGNPVSVAIGIVSWAVFVVDFVVHERLLRRYLGTRRGVFDLAIVVLTAPWFLLPGSISGGGIVVVLRLARVARLVIASKGARQLFDRLGRVALVAGSVMVAGAVAAYYAEHPVNPEFATFGDSLWWAIVTLTTVGYGDIVPETTTGRVAAVMIMLTGVAVLGLLAGSLASFFRLQPDGSAADRATPEPATPSTGLGSAAPVIPVTAPTAPSGLDLVLSELTQLRTQVGELTDLKAQLAVLTARLGADDRGVADSGASPDGTG